MKAKWIVPLVAVTGLLVAMAAFAADAAKKAAAPGTQKHVVRVEVSDDGDPGEEEPGDLVWEDEDGLGHLALGDDDGDDDGERRIVIRRRTGRMGGGHPGMMGRWGGAALGRGIGHGMGRGFDGAMGGGMGMARAFATLDLSDAQRQKLADLHERQARRDVQARADLQIARMDMRKLLEAEKPDAAAINAQVDRLAKLGAEMKKGHIGTLLEARALLTPEQQKQLRESRLRGPRRMMFREGAPGGLKGEIKGGMHGVPGVPK